MFCTWDFKNAKMKETRKHINLFCHSLLLLVNDAMMRLNFIF